MINKPIYKPKGKAKEYGDYAINIYTGCTHGCTYCYAPGVLRKSRESFAQDVRPREDIVESVKRQLERSDMKDQLIHLCFTCDPYPAGVDTTATREIIKAIKASGNHVQILTKNGVDAMRDLAILDENDWFGVTLSGWSYNTEKYEPHASDFNERLHAIDIAHILGINTWVSCEPIIDQKSLLTFLKLNWYAVDKYKFGKPNYFSVGDDLAPMPWGEFGIKLEEICKKNNLNYYIKEGLRKEIEDWRENHG